MQRFLSLLQRADLELDSEEIADMLWLAGQIDVGVVLTTDGVKKNNRDKKEPPEQPRQKLNSDTGGKPLSSLPPEPPANVVLPPMDSDASRESSNTFADLPFKAPAAPALRDRLKLSRSLRPLRRKVSSSREMILDEEATAIAMVESGDRQWSPVLKATQERWLDLALVVESTKSTIIWQELIAEIQQLLERSGAFRTMRIWTIQVDEVGEIQLFPRRKAKGLAQKSRQPKELLEPAGRQLILILSDCVSPIWRQEKIQPWLKKWSKSSLMAILQFFPEQLWERSALGLGSLVSLSAFARGTANSRLVVIDLPVWRKLDRLQDLILPVIALEPGALGQWAKVMDGVGNAQTAGVVFGLGSKNITTTTEESQNLLPSDLESLTADELVRRFRATASPLARRLAVLMSIVPVSLPIVHLIQEAMLPLSGQVHVAEVFMSELVVASSSGYDFVAGAREIFQVSVSKSETFQLLNRVAEYIAERAGYAQRSFAALLRKCSEAGNVLDGDLAYFAQLSMQVLRQMGGEYEEWVNKLAQVSGYQISEVEVVTIEYSNEPVLERYEFEVATLRVTEEVLELEDVLKIANEAMKARTGKELTVVLQEIIKGAWYKQSYIEIANQSSLPLDEVKKLAASLFRNLSKELRISISKSNIAKAFSQLAGKPTKAGLEVVRVPGAAEQFVEFLGVGDARSLSQAVELAMVRIPAEAFMMGSPADELKRSSSEGAQRIVTVPEFYLGKYSVTQAQWRAVANLPPVERDLQLEPSRFSGDDLPVEQVSWYEAEEFCRRLSVLTGRVYRLPSEAEWEYACRGRTTTPFHFGETISTDLANYDGNYVYGNGEKGVYREKTTPVGSLNAANIFGLHDMHGNVFEWCLDHYHDSYEGAPADGSAWIDPDVDRGTRRMVRGGCWNYFPQFCRSAYRNYYNPDYQNFNFGFRVVCEAARTL